VPNAGLQRGSRLKSSLSWNTPFPIPCGQISGHMSPISRRFCPLQLACMPASSLLKGRRGRGGWPTPIPLANGSAFTEGCSQLHCAADAQCDPPASLIYAPSLEGMCRDRQLVEPPSHQPHFNSSREFPLSFFLAASTFSSKNPSTQRVPIPPSRPPLVSPRSTPSPQDWPRDWVSPMVASKMIDHHMRPSPLQEAEREPCWSRLNLEDGAKSLPNGWDITIRRAPAASCPWLPSDRVWDNYYPLPLPTAAALVPPQMYRELWPFGSLFTQQRPSPVLGCLLSTRHFKASMP